MDRLQGIDISQPFVARIFGLAELKMDVAGGGSREGSLAFLRLREAQELRSALLSRRDAVRAGEVGDTGDPGDAGPVEVAPSPDRVLLSLDPGMLVVSLLLSAEFGAFLVSTLVFAGLFAFFGQIVGGLAAAVPLLGGLAVTLFRKLSAYYRFTVAETSAGLQVRRGPVRARRADDRGRPASRAWWSPSRCCGAGWAGPRSTSRSRATRAATATAGRRRPR